MWVDGKTLRKGLGGFLQDPAKPFAIGAELGTDAGVASSGPDLASDQQPTDQLLAPLSSGRLQRDRLLHPLCCRVNLAQGCASMGF